MNYKLKVIVLVISLMVSIIANGILGYKLNKAHIDLLETENYIKYSLNENSFITDLSIIKNENKYKYYLIVYLSAGGCKSCNNYYAKKISEMYQDNKNKIKIYYSGENTNLFYKIKPVFEMQSIDNLQDKAKYGDYQQPFSVLLNNNSKIIIGNIAFLGKYDVIDEYFEKVKYIMNNGN